MHTKLNSCDDNREKKSFLSWILVWWSLFLLYNMMYIHATGVRSKQPALVIRCPACVLALSHPQQPGVPPPPSTLSLHFIGAAWNCSSSPIYYLVNIMFRSKKESKWSKNRGKNKSFTGLQFVLYSTSASYREPAFLFPQNTLKAYMTELRYLVFERQKLSHPKQLAEQHYNESALEKRTD